MGSGIVSIALDLGHETTLSLALLAITLLVFALLAWEVGHDLARERPRLQIEARSPDSFTLVAATAVIAARLTLAGWNRGGELLLVVAFSAWVALLTPVARHWTTPTTGTSFLPVVATEALAVVAATLAGRLHAEVLAAASLAPFLIGLALYPLVAIRFDPRQLLTGRGDHWIRRRRSRHLHTRSRRPRRRGPLARHRHGRRGRTQPCRGRSLAGSDAVAARPRHRRGAPPAPAARPSPLVERLPRRHVLHLQHRRRPPHRLRHDHQPRPRIYLDCTRRLADDRRGRRPIARYALNPTTPALVRQKAMLTSGEDFSARTGQWRRLRRLSRRRLTQGSVGWNGQEGSTGRAGAKTDERAACRCHRRPREELEMGMAAWPTRGPNAVSRIYGAMRYDRRTGAKSSCKSHSLCRPVAARRDARIGLSRRRSRVRVPSLPPSKCLQRPF